ncbi:unnamed protein product [Auanema sp. JU1783]|nr:unnamed protein product [Auanema sp. JU1783]
MTTQNDAAVLNAILNPMMPTDAAGGDKAIPDDAPIDHPNIEESKKTEVLGVKEAEAGNIDKSVELFTQAIELCPVNPSAYNNRAQSFRLQNRNEDALKDLEEAIRLSNSNGKSGCQALVQRALLHKRLGNDDAAREDFQTAADLGSSFAKMQLVALNPYAAMCNQMLAQVFNDLKEGKETK